VSAVEAVIWYFVIIIALSLISVVLGALAYYLKHRSPSGHIRCELNMHRWTFVQLRDYYLIREERCVRCGLARSSFIWRG
jgi:hypothetical protein